MPFISVRVPLPPISPSSHLFDHRDRVGTGRLSLSVLLRHHSRFRHCSPCYSDGFPSPFCRIDPAVSLDDTRCLNPRWASPSSLSTRSGIIYISQGLILSQSPLGFILPFDRPDQHGTLVCGAVSIPAGLHPPFRPSPPSPVQAIPQPDHLHPPTPTTLQPHHLFPTLPILRRTRQPRLTTIYALFLLHPLS
jgi:hypothetical protein